MITLAYAGSFLALAALAGLAAASGSRWLLRLPLLAATPLLALAVWWQLSQRDGWPTSARPTDGSAFVAGVVQSPAPGDAGAIYLWAQPPGSAKPRAYRLPYSPGLEQQVARAAAAARRGIPIAMRTKRTTGRKGQHGQRGALRFYREPPPGLDVKGRPSAGGG
jgi:hypothetical protein